MKGQISIEFLAAFFLYLLAVVVVFQFISGEVPGFQKSLEKKPVHYEAKYVSDQVLTKPGYSSFGSGGTKWEENSSTRNALKNFGLAKGYLVLDREKLMNISSVGKDRVNYTQFRHALGVDNDYRFKFVLKPLVETLKTFKRNSSSSPVVEPSTGLYSVAGEEVHYGSVRLAGQQVYFLVTSHRSRYNTTYVSLDQNFNSGEQPLGVEDYFTVNGRNYTIDSIQDRDYESGGLVALQRDVKEFGAKKDLTANIMKMNRYVTYKAKGSRPQPMLVEVYAW
ncbi:MAG: hypothetical protein ABEJ87_01055 [Candidatus Nanohalobium sp.]